MKEYKVVLPNLGILKRVEKLEDLMNQLAREGWEFKQVTSGGLLIMERSKNR